MRTALTLAASLAMASGAAHAQNDAEQVLQSEAETAPPPSDEPTAAAGPANESPTIQEPLGPIESLGGPGEPRADRLTRATALLARLDDQEIARAVAGAIASGPSDARRLLLQAIDSAPPPEALRGAILNLARQRGAPSTDRAAAISIAARFYDRETASALIEIASAETDPTTKAVAFSAMRELSGRTDLGDDANAWADWLREAYTLSEVEWESNVSRRLHARLLRRDREFNTAMTQLIDAYRRLNLARDPADRPQLQAELLRSPMRALRELGFELVNRELAESRRPGDTVEQAAIPLLGSSFEDERIRAAVLLGRLAPDEAREPLIQALQIEEDAAAASAMLRVARRWPGPLVVSSALSWLERDIRTAPAAAEALVAMDDAGLLGQPDYERIAEALSAIDTERWTSAISRLLVQAGNPTQRDLVAALLDDPDPAKRLMAARALQSRAEYLDRLIESAFRYPALYTPAVQAVARHRPTVEGYRTVSELPDPGDGSRDAALAGVIAAMPISELNRAAMQLASGPEQRERLLADLERPARQDALATDDFERFERGVLMLGEARIDLGRPASALDALDLLSPAAPETDVAQRSHLRTTALIMLDELDDAEAVNAGAETWLDALARSAELPHAASVRDRVEALFGAELSTEQLARLRELGDEIERARNEEVDEEQSSRERSDSPRRS